MGPLTDSTFVGEMDVVLALVICAGCDLPLDTMVGEPLVGEMTEEGADVYHLAHAPKSLQDATFEHTVAAL